MKLELRLTLNSCSQTYAVLDHFHPSIELLLMVLVEVRMGVE